MKRALASLCAVAVCSGCAWTNRDNRPVWNAFEDHLVPADRGWFVATLPLTVPAGLAAILVDTFVAHPVQVVDDAWGDARDLWRELDWSEHYYTELAAAPFRAVATPLWFAGSFLARSALDVPDHVPPQSAEERAAEAVRLEAAREAELLAWLADLAGGGRSPRFGPAPARWTEAMQRAFEDARARADALGRIALYRSARAMRLGPWEAEPWLGLTDPDPVVRYVELTEPGFDVAVPGALRAALCDDPDEAVRLVARARWRGDAR